ncbi:MAG: hypothetical protein QW506_01570 [Thermoproteota archaeon]
MVDTLTEEGVLEAIATIDFEKDRLKSVEEALDYWAETEPKNETLSWWRMFFKSAGEKGKKVLH